MLVSGRVYIGTTPHPVTVTTRIIPFLVGNPNLNLHLRLASWVGVDRRYIVYDPTGPLVFFGSLIPAGEEDVAEEHQEVETGRLVVDRRNIGVKGSSKKLHFLRLVSQLPTLPRKPHNI